jgi:dTDP-glucose 4,6-dehydratase
MRILVTGATGFIGTARCLHLSARGDEVIAVGRTHNGRQGIVLYTDIANRDSIKQLVARYRPERIEHFAAQSTVSISRYDPYTTYRDNILGTISVLETAKELNVPTLVFTTDKYYGNVKVANEETRPVITSGAYETSKFCQDVIAQSYRLQSVDVRIARSCNVFGPNDYNSRIVPNSIRDLRQGKQPIIFKGILGIRQFIYIKDLVRALDVIWDAPDWIYNIGTEIKLSQEQVVTIIVDQWNKLYNKNIEPEYKEVKDLKEIPEQFLSWGKIHKLGWHPIYTFEEGIKEILEDNDGHRML